MTRAKHEAERLRCRPSIGEHKPTCDGNHVQLSRADAAKNREAAKRFARRSRVARMRESRKRVVVEPLSRPVRSANVPESLITRTRFLGTTGSTTTTQIRDDLDPRTASEIARWLRYSHSDPSPLLTCPLLWRTSRTWVCLICRDALPTASVAGIHAVKHVDPTTPLLERDHPTYRGEIPADRLALATAKLAEYQGWPWWPSLPMRKPIRIGRADGEATRAA